MAAPFGLSPSRVARFFFHECERYLWFASARGPSRVADGVPVVVSDRSLLTRAILESGFAWEERIIEELLGGAVYVTSGSQSLRERHHSPLETVELLSRLVPGEVVYQATLQTPLSFYGRFGLDPGVVDFLECRPDLLMVVDGLDGLEVRVVDAKASDLMKLSHRVQVALYSVLLEHVVRDAGLSDRLAVSRVGGVWLHGQAEPEWFDLSRVRAPLEMFLAHELMPILRSPASEAFWHLYFRCEWCDYFEHCREEATATDDVSLVPYLSTFAKRHLRTEAGVRSVADLVTVLESDEADAVLAGCGSLEGRAVRLRGAVEALRSGSAVPTGAASVGMPKGEHVRVCLTLQSEPVTGSLYAYVIRRVGGRDLLPDDGAELVGIAPSDSAEHLVGLRRGLIVDLSGMLDVVDAFNRGNGEWKAQRTVQVYVFDTYERGLLVRALLDEIETAGDLSAEALSLLFWFQHPDLVGADHHPANEVFFPVVVLVEVVRQLLALPVPVVYRLAEVSEVLKPDQGWVHRHDDYHDFAFSNRMKSNAIFEVWRRGRDDIVANIEWQLRSRVRAASSIVTGIRQHLDGTGALFAWPPKFFLPGGLEFAHPVLSRLAFIARYETVLRYLEVRNARVLPRAELLNSDRSLLVEHLGEQRFRLHVSQSDVELEPSAFFQFILTADDDAGERARLVFDDFRYREGSWAPRHLPAALARVFHVDGDVVTLELEATAAFGPLVVGGQYWLSGRYMDLLTSRLVGELRALDAEPDPWFTRVITDPVGTRQRAATTPEIRDGAARLARQHGMTPSQLEAFDGVLDMDLQLVWGPPGTGKTHWLALSLLCLVEAHRATGRGLMVLVTSFTNAAIDNCLSKIRSLQAELGVVEGGVGVYKVGFDADLQPRDVPWQAMREDALIVGATVWQAAKIEPGELTYDVVVIDEGSQLKVGEAAIAVRRLGAGGRLVVTGDDEQLPPIVQGEYPVTDDAPPLHRSILEALRFHDPRGEHGLLRTLLENFRMNDRLCRYPSESIYPPGYAPATATIAQRRLPLLDRPDDAFLAALLDPEFPVVVCVAEGVRATRQNPVEADLVADLAVTVRRLLPAVSDHDFWTNHLFVVSPHHAQINLIRRALHDRYEWHSPPFVDTVDKMQGQECDLVIVSYGVSDVEYALSEREFIYSRNRLNVSITRARTKTIVLVSRTLLEPPIQAFDSDDVADGIAYMQGWARWCEQQSPPLTLDRNGTTFTILRG